MECTESDCDRPAAVELHIPWTDNRLVCAAHARVLGRRDGVVADPIPERAETLLEREDAGENEPESERAIENREPGAETNGERRNR